MLNKTRPQNSCQQIHGGIIQQARAFLQQVLRLLKGNRIFSTVAKAMRNKLRPREWNGKEPFGWIISLIHSHLQEIQVQRVRASGRLEEASLMKIIISPAKILIVNKPRERERESCRKNPLCFNERVLLTLQLRSIWPHVKSQGLRQHFSWHHSCWNSNQALEQ